MLEAEPAGPDGAVLVEDDILAVLFAADAVGLTAGTFYLNVQEPAELLLEGEVLDVGGAALFSPLRLGVGEVLEDPDPGVDGGLHRFEGAQGVRDVADAGLVLGVRVVEPLQHDVGRRAHSDQLLVGCKVVEQLRLKLHRHLLVQARPQVARPDHRHRDYPRHQCPQHESANTALHRAKHILPEKFARQLPWLFAIL